MSKLLFILFLSMTHSAEIKVESTIADSLPDNIPFIKSVIWGENGLARDSFIDPKSRMQELRIRKNMLQWHQRLALLTFAAMTYQTHIGYEMVNTNNGYSKYKDLHMKLGYTTFGSYMMAASMSIFAPPGMKYTKKFSSNKLHRYLAIIHFSGMLLQPWLGYKTSIAGIECQNEIPGACDQRRKFQRLHKTIGGVTISSYSIAFLTTLFK